MPLTFLPGQKERILKRDGYDPLNYDIDDEGQVIERSPVPSPSITSPIQTDEISPALSLSNRVRPKSSASSAFWTGAKSNIGSTLGGLGATAAVASIPATGGLSLPVALPLLFGAGLVGGVGGKYLQDVTEKGILSEETNRALMEERLQAQEEHPVASTVGALATQAPFLRPSIGTLKSAAQGLIGQLPSRIARTTAPSVLTPAQKAAIANVGLGTTIGAAGPIASSLVTQGELPSIEDVLMSSLGELGPIIEEILKRRQGQLRY